jgi:hypothetical protein
MGRIIVLIVLLYGYGDRGFDGHRPASLDRPLRELHKAIDTAARDVQRTLVAIDDAMPKVRRLGDELRRIGEVLAAALN